MSRLAPLFVAAMVATGADSVAAETRVHAVYWQPYSVGSAATPARLRNALERNLVARGAGFVDGSDAAPVVTPLRPALASALEAYRAFRFADAVARLDALAEAARAAGGGDLDARSLSDIYLYRGLAHLELGQADAFWDDFVRAARLEPARVLDPARFAPRAVAAYHRAATEALAVAPVSVAFAPAVARLAVDGRDVDGPLSLTPGTHFVRAVDAGLAPWSGTIEVTTAQQRIALPLTPLRPTEERLTALAGGGRALTVVVTREGAGWRLRVHDLAAAGRTVDTAVDADSAEGAVDAALHQLLDAAPAPAARVATPRKHVPWWVWTVVGTAATAAIVVPIAVVYGPSSNSGTVGGTIGALR